MNCRSCDKHRRSLIALTKSLGVSINIHDIDDGRYFQTALRASKLYGVKKMPSVVILDEFRNVVCIIPGIRNSISQIENILNEKVRTTD
jgi:hypothetical protein